MLADIFIKEYIRDKKVWNRAARQPDNSLAIARSHRDPVHFATSHPEEEKCSNKRPSRSHRCILLKQEWNSSTTLTDCPRGDVLVAALQHELERRGGYAALLREEEERKNRTAPPPVASRLIPSTSRAARRDGSVSVSRQEASQSRYTHHQSALRRGPEEEEKRNRASSSPSAAAAAAVVGGGDAQRGREGGMGDRRQKIKESHRCDGNGMREGKEEASGRSRTDFMTLQKLRLDFFDFEKRSRRTLMHSEHDNRVKMCVGLTRFLMDTLREEEREWREVLMQECKAQNDELRQAWKREVEESVLGAVGWTFDLFLAAQHLMGEECRRRRQQVAREAECRREVEKECFILAYGSLERGIARCKDKEWRLSCQTLQHSS